MPRRRLYSVTRVDELAAQMLPIIDEISRTPCPECGAFTLYGEVAMRSGIAVKCEGLAPHAPEGECSFVAYSLLSSERELPASQHPEVS
jgi:hypothetical protein